jgi:dTDP-4-amino-4,6-dideoxygalactose transaminase
VSGAPPDLLAIQREGVMGRRAVLVGRGTTALWLALRAVARRAGPGEVILPDLLCLNALEGVLLAGFTPIFAEVDAARFTLEPESVARCLTPDTRVVLVAHVFGHIADVDAIRATAPGIPIVEDAVQGFGGSSKGRPAGSLGDLSFVSFDSAKMIGGRGGLLVFDDESLSDGLEADLRGLDQPPLRLELLARLLPHAAASAYERQLRNAAPSLLHPFDPSPANVRRIEADWQSLPARVTDRNARAHVLQARLSGLGLALPDLREGDAIWRYTIGAPSSAWARRISHRLQRAALNGSNLYPSLGGLFGQRTHTGTLSKRLINLWVDEYTTESDLHRAADVIRDALSPGRTRST